MILNADDTKPIYVQIAEWLENEILNGTILEDGKMYSQYQLAELFNINPATAAKGITMLADNDILYKKRGLGMFVSNHARNLILNKRKSHMLTRLIRELTEEAKRLSISRDSLLEMVGNIFDDREGSMK